MVSRKRWREVRAARRADRDRLAKWLAAGRMPFSWWHPGNLCVALYRLSNYFEGRGWRWMARAAWQMNLLVTGADLPPAIELGPGLLIPVPAGVAIACRAGRNLTVMACAGIGGELGRNEDVGAGPSLACLGDDVTMEPHAGILGPVMIGDRCTIKSRAVVITGMPPDSIAVGPPARFFPPEAPPAKRSAAAESLATLMAPPHPLPANEESPA